MRTNVIIISSIGRHLTFIIYIPQFIVAVRILDLYVIFLRFENLVGIIFGAAQWSNNSFPIFMVE